MPNPLVFDYVDHIGDAVASKYLRRPLHGIHIHADGVYLGTVDSWKPAVELKTAPTIRTTTKPCEVTFTVPKNKAYNWVELLKQMHGRAKREDPEKQEKQAMKEKASTYYKRELLPLKHRALGVQSRHQHAIKKYHNDRSTHDGSMVVDRSLLVTMLEAVANVMRTQKVRDIEGITWNLHTVYMETTFDLGRSQEEEGDLLFPWKEPTTRVPADLVIDLVTLYHNHVVQQQDFPQGSTKGLPERLPEGYVKPKVGNKDGKAYKRTVTKPSRVDVDY